MSDLEREKAEKQVAMAAQFKIRGYFREWNQMGDPMQGLASAGEICLWELAVSLQMKLNEIERSGK